MLMLAESAIDSPKASVAHDIPEENHLKCNTVLLAIAFVVVVNSLRFLAGRVIFPILYAVIVVFTVVKQPQYALRCMRVKFSRLLTGGLLD